MADPTTLELSEKTDNGHCRLELTGWIDSSNSYLLEEWLEANLGEGYKRITFCCKGLEFISSAGIRVFLLALRRIGTLDDCELMFADIGESVMGVMTVTGLDKLINQAGS